MGGDDGSRVMESLDSLWFFHNVFSSTSSEPLLLREPVVDDERAQPPPTSQKLQNQESPTPKCPRCGELSAEIKPAEMWKPVEEDPEVVLEMEASEKEERRKLRRRTRRRRRSKRSAKQKREVLGELDLLCFDENEVCETRMAEARSCGYYHNQIGTFGVCDQNKYYKLLPPFDDNMAMKEHLKSWAYAVASTVR